MLEKFDKQNYALTGGDFQMRKYVYLLIFILLIFVLSLPVLADDIELKDPWISQKPQGKHGGTLVSSMLDNPKTFNPIMAVETSSTDIIDYIFETLVIRNGATMELEAELARDWKINNDGTLYTFYLRRGLQWSDGAELTAEDVIFSFNVFQKMGLFKRWGLEKKSLEYRKLNKTTVQFELTKPFPQFLSTVMRDVYILPRHKLYDIWENGNLTRIWGKNSDLKQIVGSGPFTLVNYIPNKKVVMSKNPYYWRKDPAGKSLPYIKKWNRLIVDNLNNMKSLFEKGKTHYISIKGENYNYFKKRANKDKYQIVNAGPTFSTNFLVFNMNSRNPDLDNTPWKYDWFTNLNFRRAVAYAMDKQTMIDEALGGFGTPQWSPISVPNKKYLNEDVKKYHYSLEKAREELRKGGFSWNEEGQLVDKEDRIVKFKMKTNSGNTTRIKIMKIIAEKLRKLGLEVHTSSIKFNKLVNKLTQKWDFDTIFLGLTGSMEPLASGNVWYSFSHLHMWNPRQPEPATKWEARIDEIFSRAAVTVDRSERIKLFNEFQEIVSRKLPVIYTVTPDCLYAIRNNLENIEPTAIGGVTWNIYELWLK